MTTFILGTLQIIGFLSIPFLLIGTVSFFAQRSQRQERSRPQADRVPLSEIHTVHTMGDKL